MSVQTIDVDVSLLAAAEEPLSHSFETDVAEEISAVDDACAVLLHVLRARGKISNTVPVEEGEELPEHGEYSSLMQRQAPLWQMQAQTEVGVKGLRVIRAARAVLRYGYEWEAQAFVRIIVELDAHRKAFLDDDTGRQAYLWLMSRRSSRKSMLEPELHELYENLCRDSHGDAATVKRLFDPTDRDYQAAPRRTHRTRATLLTLAKFAHDQALVVAQLSGKMQIHGLAELERRIKDAWTRLRADAGELHT